MRRYQATAPITLHAGVIGLSKAQAAPRMRSLQERSQGDGFDITGTVQFCAGEVILLDPAQIQAVEHALLDLAGEREAEPEVEAVEAAEDKQAAKPKPKAKAKKKAG